MLIIVDLKYIRKFVENNLGIVLSKNTREREYVEARALYFKLCRDFTSKSWFEIGKTLGKNHATVIHAVNNVYPVAQIDNKRLDHLYSVFEKSSESNSLKDASEDPYEDNLKLRSEIVRLSVQINQMKESMTKQQIIFEDLEDDEVQTILEKISIFKKVIQSQRHMKV
jgi:hypothetical protein